MNTETYWIAGYTVKGAPDVIVGRYHRSRKAAREAAETATVEPLAHLIELGIDGEVTSWTQKWKSITTTEYDKREVEVCTPVKRSFETRELDA